MDDLLTRLASLSFTFLSFFFIIIKKHKTKKKPFTHTIYKYISMLQSSPAIQFPSDIKKYPQSEIPSTSSSPYQKRPEKMKLQQQQQQQSPRSSILTPPPTPGLFTTSRTPSLSSSSLQTNTSDPLLDHSHLRPGQNASLLSYDQTINMYRENAKKTNDTNIQCDFAMFLVEAGGSDHLLEAEKILKQVAVRGHGESQYYLGNMYANGMLNKKRHGQPEFEKAFPLFVQSAKHHHPDAAYRYLSFFFGGGKGIALFGMEPNKYCHDDA